NRYYLDFVDQEFVLFKKNGAHLMFSGFVYSAPYCWNKVYGQSLRKELKILESLSGTKKDFSDFVSVVLDYESSEDKSLYVQSYRDKVLPNAAIRFLGYRALEMKDYHTAYNLLASLVDLQSKDYL